jgi:hypothetical protein
MMPEKTREYLRQQFERDQFLESLNSKPTNTTPPASSAAAAASTATTPSSSQPMYTSSTQKYETLNAKKEAALAAFNDPNSEASKKLERLRQNSKGQGSSNDRLG